MENNRNTGSSDVEHATATTSEKAATDRGVDHVTSDVDVIQVTKERPYLELNFIGTYFAVCLGALACYGGFVMPATSLALINEDIGQCATFCLRYEMPMLMSGIRAEFEYLLGCIGLDSMFGRWIYPGRPSVRHFRSALVLYWRFGYGHRWLYHRGYSTAY